MLLLKKENQTLVNTQEDHEVVYETLDNSNSS